MLISFLTVLRTCAASLAIAAAGMQPISVQAKAETLKPEAVEILNNLGLGDIGTRGARLDAYRRATWQTGPATVKLGESVVVQIPAGVQWLEPAVVAKIEGAHGATIEDPTLRIQSGDAWALMLSLIPSGHVEDVTLPNNVMELTAQRLQPWPVQEDFTIGRDLRYTPEKLKWLKSPTYDRANHLAAYAYTTSDDVHLRERQHLATWLRLGAREVLMGVLDSPFDDSVDARIKAVDQFMSGAVFTEGHRHTDAGWFEKTSQASLTRLVAGPPSAREGLASAVEQKDQTKKWWLIAAVLIIVASLIWGRRNDTAVGQSGTDTKTSTTP